MSLGLLAAVPAQAETWACLYDGTWKTHDGSEKGTFDWKVTWQGAEGQGWKVIGDYRDRYGESVLDGTCDDRSCLLTQVYQSGELKGKQYYWKGKYSDESAGGGRTINRFEGSWGETRSTADGSWRATATCSRN